MLLLRPLFFFRCFFWECSRNSTKVSNMYITKAHENITHSLVRTHIGPERLSLSLSLSPSRSHTKTDKHRHRRLRDYMMRRRQHTLTYTFFSFAVVVAVALFLSLYRRTPHNTRKYRYCFQPEMYMRCSDRFENFILTISIMKNIRKNKSLARIQFHRWSGTLHCHITVTNSTQEQKNY